MTAITAVSEVTIANMALSALSKSISIQSFSDETEAAKVCGFWYPLCRDQLLRSAPWNFAYTSAALASDATVFPGWTYAYQYPNDCLQAIAVVTFAGQRLAQMYWNTFWSPFPLLSGPLPKIPFKVVQSQGVSGQKAILTDIPAPAYLLYIQGVTNPALFDVLFIEALSLALAAKAGGPLQVNLQKVQALSQAAEMRRLEAIAQCLNEGQQDIERPSPSVTARW